MDRVELTDYMNYEIPSVDDILSIGQEDNKGCLYKIKDSLIELPLALNLAFGIAGAAGLLIDSDPTSGHVWKYLGNAALTFLPAIIFFTLYTNSFKLKTNYSSVDDEKRKNDQNVYDSSDIEVKSAILNLSKRKNETISYIGTADVIDTQYQQNFLY